MPTPTAPPDRAPGVRIATVAGIPVYLGTSWFLLALVVLVLFGGQIARQRPDLGILAYGIGLLYAVVLLVAVLVHESAHAVAARRSGLPVHRVVADLWGGHTAYDPTGSTPGSSAVVAVVGPLANAALAVPALLISFAMEPGIAEGIVFSFAFLNAALAAFNLLPGLPLDGGQLVECAVWGATGNRNRGKVVAGWAGRVVAVLVLVVFVGWPLLRGESLDLTSSIWFFLIAGFLWMGASSAVEQGRVLDRISGVTLASVLRPANAVGHGTDLRTATSGSGIPVVVGEDGYPESLLDGPAFEAVPPPSHASTDITAVSRPQPAGWVVQADPAGDLMPVIRGLQEARTGVVAVMWDGRLRGVVTAADVNEALGEDAP